MSERNYGCVECDALRKERDEAVKALIDLLEAAKDMRPYVPEFFAEKWGHDADIEHAESALARTEGSNK